MSGRRVGLLLPAVTDELPVGRCQVEPAGDGDQAVEDGEALQFILGQFLAVGCRSGPQSGALASLEGGVGVVFRDDVRRAASNPRKVSDATQDASQILM